MTQREKRTKCIEESRRLVQEFMSGQADGWALQEAGAMLREAKLNGGPLTDGELGVVNLWMEGGHNEV